MTQPLTPQENRWRSYHEAGHALLALHLGVVVRQIVGGDVACTEYDDESCRAAPARSRGMILLGGGIAEDVVFMERSPDCCTEDFARFNKIFSKLSDPERDSLRLTLEGEARDILSQPSFRSALEILAPVISVSGFVAGRRVLELLAKKCPEILPHLRVQSEP